MTAIRTMTAMGGALALLGLLASPAATAAGFAGRVVDKSGDPVPGAVVVFRCGEGQETFSVTTDENGRFLSPRLVGGECTVEASLPAMGDRPPAQCRVAAGQREEIELKLDLDVLCERIAVKGSPVRDSVESREIRESFAYDAGEALARIDGVHKIRKGGIANDVVVRGFKADNLNVLIDGQRIYGACPNRMDPPSFHVDFAEIERIDVKKGPFDTDHAGSLGGSVNIVTREPEPGAHAGVQAAVGSFGYVAPSITASYADPRWDVSGGYSQRQADPYEDGNGTPFTELEGGNYKPEASDEQAFHVDTMWAGGAVTLGRSHRLKLRMTRQEGDTQLYPYLLMDANYDNASRVAATYDAQGPFGWIETVEASASYASVDHDMTDALRISSNGMPLPYSMATLADSAVLGESLRFVLHGGFAVGAEAYQRNWDATTRLAGPKKDYKPQSSIPDVDTRAAGLFATWETALSPAWKLRAGARADRIATQADSSLANVDLYYAYHGTRSTSRSDFLPAANVSATWAVSRAWELFAGLGRTARSPDPSERYFALKRMGSDWVGDPDLAPSKNTELDLGARLKAAAFSLDANVYHAWLADYIVVVNAARQNTVPGVMNTSARSYANDDARMWGGEATARWLVGGRIALAAGISYVRGVQDLNAALGIHDPDLPEMAPLTGRVSARYDTGKRFVEVEGVASAQQDRVNTDLNERRTPGWGIVNLRGGMELNRFSVYAGVGNLFDRFYRENYSYQRDPFRSGVEVPEPGRTISVSMQLRY